MSTPSPHARSPLPSTIFHPDYDRPRGTKNVILMVPASKGEGGSQHGMNQNTAFHFPSDLLVKYSPFFEQSFDSPGHPTCLSSPPTPISSCARAPQTPHQPYTTPSPGPRPESVETQSPPTLSTPSTAGRPRGPRPLPTPPSREPVGIEHRVIYLPLATVEGLAVILDEILFDEDLAPRRYRPSPPPPLSPFRRIATPTPIADTAKNEHSPRSNSPAWSVITTTTHSEDGISTLAPSAYRDRDPGPSPPSPGSYSVSGSERTVGPGHSRTASEGDDTSVAILTAAYNTATAYSFPLHLIFGFLDVGEENPWVGYAIASLSAPSFSRLGTSDPSSNPDANSAATARWSPTAEMKTWSTRSLSYILSSLPPPILSLLRLHRPKALEALLGLHAAWQPPKSNAIDRLLAPPPRGHPAPFPRECKVQNGWACDAKLRFGTFSNARYETGRIIWSWLLHELAEIPPEVQVAKRHDGVYGGPEEETVGMGSRSWRTKFIDEWDLDRPMREIVECTPCREALVSLHMRSIRYVWPAHPGHAAWGKLPRSI